MLDGLIGLLTTYCTEQRIIDMSLIGLGEVADFAGKIADKIWPDASQAQKDALAFQLAQMQGQMATNTAEASNPSLFVAGWRPFVGWVCGTGFAITVLGPLLSWIAMLFGKTVAFPPLDTQALMTLLMGMLGLGGMRTVEKLNDAKGSKKLK